MSDPIDLTGLSGPDLLSRQAVSDRASRVLREPGALGRLDQMAAWLAGWQRTDCPTVTRPVLILAAGDHGVTRRGVSQFPSDVTKAMVDAVRAGVSTSTVLARGAGAEVRLVDAGVGAPAGDITVEAALDEERFNELVELGRDTVSELDTDLLMLGGMGVGNSTSAAALASTLCGGPVENWVGRGTRLDDETFDRKLAAVEAARTRVGQRAPIEVLRQLGGSEMAVLAGACVEARRRSIPTLIDGFGTTAALAPLGFVSQTALAHCMAAHVSPEPGHARLLDRLGMQWFLDLDMRVGEGSGALVAVPVLRMAVAAVIDVATFEEWGLR